MGGCSGKHEKGSISLDKEQNHVQNNLSASPPEALVAEETAAEEEEIEEEERGPGSQVYIYKGNPTIKNVKKGLIWLPNQITPGPRSRYVAIVGMGKIKPTDNDNNYLWDPEKDPNAFDAVHTFGVVQRVVNMYKRSLLKLHPPYGRRFKWQWGKEPLTVFPRAGRRKDAAYVRNRRSLSFYNYEDKETGQTIETCRSFCAVAHETGHAILDAIKPGLADSRYPETQALHEAFADLTALFAVLDQMDMCDMIISRARADLSDKTALPRIAQEFGLSDGNDCMKALNKSLKVSDVTEDRYEWSQVFSGAIYNIITAVVKRETDSTLYDPAATLYRSTKHVLAALLRAIHDVPDHATFADVAQAMAEGAESERHKRIMEREFAWRQFFDPSVQPKPK